MRVCERVRERVTGRGDLSVRLFLCLSSRARLNVKSEGGRDRENDRACARRGGGKGGGKREIERMW